MPLKYLIETEKERTIFKLFDEVFEKYKPSEVFLSFNGGKDCTIILDLILTYFKCYEKVCAILLLYIQPKNSFEEIEEFINLISKTYNVEIIKKEGALKEILKQICSERPQLKAVIMGCRRTDPYCKNLETMQETDCDWPRLLRINPILDWTCKDVWSYIHRKQIPYCSLYDAGYTSLGDKSNTRKNPHLLRKSSAFDVEVYGPASELEDDTLERAGRI